MEQTENIFWIGHAAFYIKARSTTIFIDPFKVSEKVTEKADIILITHPHFDHNNKPDIEKVSKPETKFIAPQGALDPNEYKNLEVSMPGFRSDINGIKIEAVAAYNKTQERQKFHPRAENWVGYIIEMEGKRIYHAGDTDFIPEMEGIKSIDVALLPTGGTYTMDELEMVNAANAIKPKTVVPMHYKMLLGKEKADALEKSITEKLKNAHIMREVQDPIYSF